jgi:hypothetical protein
MQLFQHIAGIRLPPGASILRISGIRLPSINSYLEQRFIVRSEDAFEMPIPTVCVLEPQESVVYKYIIKIVQQLSA